MDGHAQYKSESRYLNKSKFHYLLVLISYPLLTVHIKHRKQIIFYSLSSLYLPNLWDLTTLETWSDTLPDTALKLTQVANWVEHVAEYHIVWVKHTSVSLFFSLMLRSSVLQILVTSQPGSWNKKDNEDAWMKKSYWL